uniref:RNA-dependent RNA polymerase n=1 Tax=Frankliniella occidentalis associated virga-like virus 2 TaxID=2767208 RepID=A0A7G9IR74_9VIRU|nr:RNA-dependent RNA polymerase [Frankliniella occidentalis associated virga-like virus 2]
MTPTEVCWKPTGVYADLALMSEFPDVCAGQPEELPDSEPPIVYNRTEPVSFFVEPVMLQDLYDSIFPGHSMVEYLYDAYDVNTNFPLHLPLSNVSLDVSKLRMGYEVKYDTLTPVLRTAMPQSRKSTPEETLLALVKRNLNVPEIKGYVDERKFANDLWKNFKRTYFSPEAYELMREYQENKIVLNSSDVIQWAKDCDVTPRPEELMPEMEALHEKELNLYQYMIKNQVKPTMTQGSVDVYAALQTIAYHPKDINVYFCPILRMCKRRLKACLKKNIVMFSDMSPEDVEKYVDKHMNIDELFSAFFAEGDFSKFDKSQDLVALLLDIECFRDMGVHEYYLQLWKEAHTHTTLMDRRNGIKAWILYQRKSGDASTFFGNTIYTMAVMAHLYDLRFIIAGFFAGDDNLVFGKVKFKDKSAECALKFNLEAKFLYHYSYPYFCSKFLIKADGRTRFVPDPIKLIKKLGRSDMRDFEHVEEYRRSLYDLCKPFSDALVHPELSRAVCERYAMLERDLSPHFSVINSLVQNPGEFANLYYLKPGDILLSDPSRPRL